jgi:acylphosphatase
MPFLFRRQFLAGLLPLPLLAQGHHMGGQDMQAIHGLFDEHSGIRRSVKKLENGVEALTESDDPKVATLLQQHVHSMKARLEQNRRIRQWDPLYAALFMNYKNVKLIIANTEKGVRIVQTSDDPKVVKLIHAHAEAVDGFVKNGYRDMHKEHPVPE